MLVGQAAPLYKAGLRTRKTRYGGMKQKKNIVGYGWVSTLEQKKKGYGIDIQVRGIEQYAQAYGLPLAAFYIDEAQSGVQERRTALQRLLRACKAGAIEAIVIPSLDRLSRSLRFAENLFYEFERLGVKVHIVDMPHYDSTDRKEVLIRQIKEAIAEEGRKDIIERLKKGREARTRDGKMSGGNMPYGYQRDNGEVRIVPEEAAIVRLIFALHNQGLKDQQITNVLNERGYRRRNGRSWIQRQVWKILRRKALYVEGMVKYGSVVGKNQALILSR